MGSRKERDKVIIQSIKTWEEWEKMKEREVNGDDNGDKLGSIVIPRI